MAASDSHHQIKVLTTQSFALVVDSSPRKLFSCIFFLVVFYSNAQSCICFPGGTKTLDLREKKKKVFLFRATRFFCIKEACKHRPVQQQKQLERCQNW